MHGLILAGGQGARLKADGVAVPKALVEVDGTPQLLRIARLLGEIGCDSVTAAIRDEVAPTAERMAPPGLRLVACRTPSSLHSLVVGLPSVPPGPVFCAMVDTVMQRADWVRSFSAAAGALSAGADGAMVVTPLVDDDAPLFVRLGPAGRIAGFSAEPETPTLVTGGVYAFSERCRQLAVLALTAGVIRMRGFLGHLIERGCHLQSIRVERIIDLDRRRDLASAHQLLASNR